MACKSLVIEGSVIQNADITLDDASGAKLGFGDQCGYSSNATRASRRKIQSASANPTYPWTIDCDDVAAFDDRSIDLSFVTFLGNKWFLGNDYYQIDMNGGGANDPFAYGISPMTRAPSNIQHPIKGRDRARVYPGDSEAGILTFNLVTSLESGYYDTLNNMIASGQRFAFFSNYHHLVKCRIDRFPPPRENGLYVDMTITLLEDA
jgi:hypothetical protein